MNFRYQPLRATQAAALVVRLAGGRFNYTKAIKALYLADRRSLLETGSPITGDAVVNMAHGPVLSTVYDCIKGNPLVREPWFNHIRTEGYDLVLEQDPGDDELSDYDVEVLTEVFRHVRPLRLREVIDEVHALPEWEHPGQTSVPVAHKRILHAAGVNDTTVEAYERLNASACELDDLRVVR